jgi:Flp pilus assembly protein TadG
LVGGCASFEITRLNNSAGGSNMIRRSHFSKGQMLAALTLVLPVLLGAMALGADFSIIYFNWALVQKAADAAALAGASQLTGQTGSASTVRPNAVSYVNGYACLNGVTDSSHSNGTLCPSPATKSAGWTDKVVFTSVTDTQVSVGIKRTVPYFFGKMIGLQQASVAAKATASVTGIGTVPTGLFPVGFQCKAPCSLSNLNGGSAVTFGQKFVGNVGASGNWQWVDVGQGSAASGLGSVLQNGSTQSFSVGQTISSSTGNKGNSNPAKTGLANRLAACSAAKTTLTSATDPCQNGAALASQGNQSGIGGSATGAVPINDPCVVTVPVVDFTGCNGKCSLTIEGFAQVYLEQNSTSTSMDTCYVQGATTTNLAGSPTAPDLGPTTPPLLTN